MLRVVVVVLGAVLAVASFVVVFVGATADDAAATAVAVAAAADSSRPVFRMLCTLTFCLVLLLVRSSPWFTVLSVADVAYELIDVDCLLDRFGVPFTNGGCCAN